MPDLSRWIVVGMSPDVSLSVEVVTLQTIVIWTREHMSEAPLVTF
jgi:hypothetical protein